MRTLCVAVVPALVLVACLAASSHAHGQAREAERIALARALFREGVAHADAGRFSEAAERFRRAHAIHATPALGYNLAAALARLGEVVEASELLRAVIQHEEAPRPLVEQAQELYDACVARIAQLTIRVTGSMEGVELRIDGSVLDQAAVGVPMPVDPGTHVVDATREGHVIAREESELDDAAREGTVLAIPAASEEPLEPVGVDILPSDPEPPAPDGGGGGMPAWVWVGGGVLVVGALIGVLLFAGVFDAPDAVQGNAMPGVLEWD